MHGLLAVALRRVRWRIALRRRRRTVAAGHDRHRAAAGAFLAAAAHDHHDQQRHDHQTEQAAQDQEQRQRCRAALHLHDGAGGDAARAVRLVVIDDETHDGLVAATVQNLVRIRRLEAGEGVAGFERRALHAHGDQLLLCALGRFDVGAGQRRRDRLPGW